MRIFDGRFNAPIQKRAVGKYTHSDQQPEPGLPSLRKDALDGSDKSNLRDDNDNTHCGYREKHEDTQFERSSLTRVGLFERFCNVSSALCKFWRLRKMDCLMPSTLAKIWLTAGLPVTTALAIAKDPSGQPTYEPPSNPDSLHVADGRSDFSEDAPHKFYRMAVTVLPAFILVGGVGHCAWVLKSTTRPAEKQIYLWLMTFTASVTWWVVSAIPSDLRDGRSISISTWLALFASYGATSYRNLRARNVHLFTTLLGGLFFTAIVGRIVMETSSQTQREKGAMEEFVKQSVTVGPTIVTIWGWVVTFVVHDWERRSDRERMSYRERNLAGAPATLSEEEGAIELGDV